MIHDGKCRTKSDTRGCGLQWFIISEGRKTGPYSPSQLSELFKQNRISVDSYVLAAGSRVARRLYCTPEALLPHFLPTAATPTNRENTTPGEETRTFIPVEHQLSDLHKETNDPRHRQLARAAEARKAAEQRMLKRQREAQHQAHHNQRQQHEERSKAAPPPSNKIQARSQAASYLSRRNRKRVHPTHPQKLQRALSRQKKRSPLPKFLLRLRAKAKAPAPAHQLPKAASEAQMRVKENFTWAKNRINPTAPRSIYQTSAHRRRKRRSQRGQFWTRAEFLITAGALLIIGVIAAAVMISGQSSHKTVKPRFTVRQPERQENPPPQQTRSLAPTAQTDDPSHRESPRTKKGRENVRPRVQRLSQQETRRSTPNASEKRQKRGVKIESRKATQPRRRNKSNTPARLQTSLPANSFAKKKALPASWPSVHVQTGRELALNKLKVVSVINITLLQIPESCQPCQIPGKLRDGTNVLLSSQSTTLWKGVIASRKVMVNAKALVTQSTQNYYTLIVQDLDPS